MSSRASRGSSRGTRPGVAGCGEAQDTAALSGWHVAYAAGLIAATLLAAIAHRLPYLPGDLPLARAVQSIDAPGFAVTMWALTLAGTTLPALLLALATAGLLLALRRPVDALFVVAAPTAAYVVTWVLKAAVGRARPSPDLLQVLHDAGEHSFPSGHVMHFTAFYGILFFIVYVGTRPSFFRSAMLVFLALPILLIGLSRVFLGAHWPSDVAGGYLWGTLLLAALIRLYRWFP